MRTHQTIRYAHVLNIPEGKSGPVEVRHLHHPAGTEQSTATMRSALLGGQKAETVRFKEATRWHELSEDGHGVWMTDLVIEQRQTDELIRHARGHVLVGGLGLGYAVVALAARPQVTAITVVERSMDIINLVWPATCDTVAKLRPDVRLYIVQSDLFTYLTDQHAITPRPRRPPFASGLFDIWQMDGETIFHNTVAPLRRLAHGVVKRLVCWNEDVMRGQLYQSLVTRYMLLKQPALQHTTFTLADLCEATDLYQAWAVPFWCWVRDTQPTDETAAFVMRQYALDYGRPEVNDGRNWLVIREPRLRPTGEEGTGK